MFRNMSSQRKITLVGLVVVLFVIYQTGILITHIGETKVSITVIPSDAKVTVNNKPSSKKVYLKPGQYTIAGSKAGWSTDTQTINVGKTSLKVNLLPAPASSGALQWLKDNPAIQQQRETLGGQNAATQSAQALKQNPVIGLLPYNSITGPFSINYGPSPTRKGGILVIISNSTPSGRQAALQWLKDHGQNPTDLQIEYDGFVNPIILEGENN